MTDWVLTRVRGFCLNIVIAKPWAMGNSSRLFRFLWLLGECRFKNPTQKPVSALPSTRLKAVLALLLYLSFLGRNSEDKSKLFSPKDYNSIKRILGQLNSDLACLLWSRNPANPVKKSVTSRFLCSRCCLPAWFLQVLIAETGLVFMSLIFCLCLDWNFYE